MPSYGLFHRVPLLGLRTTAPMGLIAPTQLNRRGRELNLGNNPLYFSGPIVGYLNNKEVKRVGMNLCAKCSSNIDSLAWFEAYEMEDTFFSWFKVVELHVWMISLRLLQDPSSEINDLLVDVRGSLIDYTWIELHNRIGSIGIKGRKRKNSLSELSDQLRISFLLYDDGVLGSDTRLANALWEGFFIKDEDVSLEKLVRLVEYVRQNLLMLEKLENTDIAIKQKFDWTNPPKLAIEQV
uniref:Ubiquinol-cytochrome c reductase complex chaperone CBP3 homolog n=1 Tax=Caligus rogercresseyi TaxID=217165 RepID=C1BQV8_CALRO|nr:Ubiquinol-cytochrome c reductase complex chaperone CBP3 homolog [Caligus rogercresseyi]